MIIIGDVHGCLTTLLALVAQLPPGEPLCFVGDLIDRGPDDLGVIDFVRAGGHRCVRGNHEDMMLGYFRRDYSGYSTSRDWAYNGGRPELEWGDRLDWIAGLPLFLEFDEVNADGRRLVVSHSHLPRVEEGPFVADNQDERYILWNREPDPVDNPHWFNVVGHTPVKAPEITASYANIDTGCVYGYTRNAPTGLTALHWPSLQTWTQPCLEHKHGPTSSSP